MVDLTKPKIEILPLQSSGFVNLRDFCHFAAIGERYWQCMFYSNWLLPELAPLFPLFSCDANGLVRLHSNIDYMLRLNIAKEFSLAEDYLQIEHQTELPVNLKNRVLERMHNTDFFTELVDRQQAFNLPAA